MLKRLFIAACALIVFSTTLSASKIHPALEEQISQSGAEFQRVVIRLADRLDKQGLEQNLSLSSYTRQASHALAVRSLQEKARTTQTNLLAFLQSEYKQGNVRNYKSFWIDNLISAEVTPELIAQLSNFPEVETIFPEFEVRTIEPVPEDNIISKSVTGAGDNLRVIGADSMWKMGYTGQGTIACNFDTGVDGIHPALINTYRGMFGYPHDQCWFDPIVADTFPHYFSQAPSSVRPHGTNTMSIMVGKDDVTGDTIGVAFDAQWIAAGVIDIDGHGYILDAFQWAADPDGDPNTVDDVPDVVNNSWGFSKLLVDCDDYFYGAIDNLEAMGTVAVFSAGNSGSNYRTLVNPANRATNAFNSFCAGMISNNYDIPVVDGMSSRGPSECNPVIIKPNVVAPGRSIPVAALNGEYAFNTGTSFSCPHLSGAVLLLRSYNPNAPVDSIKFALMQSATDLGDPGPDSASGYGLINIPAAMEILGPNDDPHVFVSAVSHASIQPGSTVDITVTLTNNGLGVLDVSGQLNASAPGVTVVEALSDFGDMAMDATSNNSSDPYQIQFSSSIPEGTEVVIDMTISGSGSYHTTLPLYFVVGNPQQNKLFTHNSGVFEFTVSGIGQYGVGPGAINDQGGVGYIYPTGTGSDLFDMGILIATDSNHISNAVRNIINIPDENFKPAPEGELITIAPSSKAAQMSLSIFNDENARQPLGLEITQKTYSYDTPVDDHIMLMVYILKNVSDSSLSNLRMAMYADWDINNFGTNYVGYDSSTHTGFMWDFGTFDTRGISVLNPEGVIAHRSIIIDSIFFGFSKSSKWHYMFYDTITTADLDYYDYSHIITTGPFNLAPGEIDTAAFAIIAADSVSDLIDLYAPAAQMLYADFLTDVPDDPVVDPVIPREFSLAQNYPNPFNPSTVIEFALEREQPVKLEIFNILGQKITTLIDQTMPAGKHRVLWDTADSESPLASGIYFYRLKGQDQAQTRKMILLK